MSSCKQVAAIFVCTLLCLLTVLIGADNTEYTDRYEECPPENKTCTYYFTVKEKLTMIYGKDLVYASGGKLYKYDEEPTDPKPTNVRVSFENKERNHEFQSFNIFF